MAEARHRVPLGSARVSPEHQSRVFREAAAEFTGYLSVLPMRHAPQDQDDAPKQMIERIGLFFKDRYLRQPFNPDAPGSVRIDREFPDGIFDSIRTLINRGALIPVPERDDADLTTLQGKRFRLAYLQAPLYGLPLRLDRAAILSDVFTASPSGQLSLDEQSEVAESYVAPHPTTDLADVTQRGYDSFLCTLGFETRSRALAEQLANCTQQPQIHAVAFEHRHDESYVTNMRVIEGLGAEILEFDDEEFRAWALEWIETVEHQRVAIDISSMSRPRIAALVEAMMCSTTTDMQADFLYVPRRSTKARRGPSEAPTALGPVSPAFAGWMPT